MPDYDSGWLRWKPDQILNHNLGTKELFVYVMYKNSEGLIQPCTLLVQWWALNEQSIIVQSAGLSLDEEFRVIIWKLLSLFRNFLYGSDNPI
jgi:hypothetical protein